MGVKGLLGLLKSIQKQTHLKQYAGQTLGVDAFGWLHRGATGCAYQLAADKPTTFYITFVLNRVRMLLDFGITPYLVFDGDAVPSKRDTNSKRREERDAAKELGLMLFKSGKKDQAQQELQKAVSITPQMTYNLIEELRRMNVQVLVAPYEADAQLVYLEKTGIIDGIISEDSDLLVFGAQRLITKLDQHGTCSEIRRADLILNKAVSFAGWSDSMFRRMAILSGCDYLKNINGIGLKTAHDFVKRHKEINKIVRMMALHGKYIVPTDYLASFEAAERAFLYHRVFCPKAGQLVFLNTIPPDLKEEDMPYLGSYVEADIAVAVACGDLNPKTKKPFQSLGGSSITPRPPQPLRRQTQGSASTVIEHKRSIDNFFRPNRTPLAELDPNSLTPSPSQQRLLERNQNASWEPRIFNSAPPLRRTLTDVSQAPTISGTTQSSRSSFLTKAATTSTYKPVKRQRLCSESDEVSPSKEVKQSRFFSHAPSEQSPLTNKKIRDRRSRKSAFDVFSDDTVEGIMISLEEQVTDAPVQTVQYSTLPDTLDTESPDDADFVPQSSPVKSQKPLVDSQSSHGTAELADLSFGSESQVTTNSESRCSDDADNFDDLLTYHITSSHEIVKAKGLHRTFSHQSPELQSAALSSLKPVRKEQAEDETSDVEPPDEDIASPQKSASSRFRSLTKTFACQSPDLQARALQSLGRMTTISNVTHITEKVPIQGSEDAIPMSSDIEPEDIEEQPQRKFDLKSFRYRA